MLLHAKWLTQECVPAEPLATTTQEIHIWWADPSGLSQSALSAAQGRFLGADECARVERFHFPDDRRSFVAGHSLLRSLVTSLPPFDVEGWTLSAVPGERPEISSHANLPALAVSLSRTRTVVAAASAVGAPGLGVDVETLERVSNNGFDIMGMVNAEFAADEIAVFREAPPDRHPRIMLEHWPIKEAVLKAVGLGLSVPLDAVIVKLGKRPQVEVRAPIGVPNLPWHLLLHWMDDSRVIAAAVQSASRPRFILEDATQHFLCPPPATSKTRSRLNQVPTLRATV